MGCVDGEAFGDRLVPMLVGAQWVEEVVVFWGRFVWALIHLYRHEGFVLVWQSRPEVVTTLLCTSATPLDPKGWILPPGIPNTC